MAQQNLAWNGLTICTTSTGGGYRITERGPAKADAVEVSIPNTAGRRLRVVGRSLGAATAFRITFEVTQRATTLSTLETLQSAIETKMQSTSAPLGTLTFSYPGSSTTITKTNMSLDDFQFGEYFGDGSNLHEIRFTVTFSKWGA